MLEISTDMLEVDTAAIETELRLLRKAEEDLREAAAALNQAWDGSAKAAYLRGYKTDLNRLRETLESLARFLEEVEAAGGEYERCESAVADAVSYIRI